MQSWAVVGLWTASRLALDGYSEQLLSTMSAQLHKWCATDTGLRWHCLCSDDDCDDNI